jgi:murein DD-endopeptidase MepM/ murein hydrolase activator NlpD
VNVGNTVQLNAVAKAADGATVSGKTFTWSSSSNSVASVSQSGLVTANSAGQVTISAATDGKTGSTQVTTIDIVASVQVSPPASSVLSGTPVALTATARNAQNGAIPGKTFVWTTSNGSVATVNNGQVTTLTPGQVTISASVDGQTGNAAIEVVNPDNIPFLSRPWPAAVDYVFTNPFDHDVPVPFQDNARKVAYWGEQYDIAGYEGHDGYDFRMPEGTPIFAAAAGTVVTISNPTFFCPLINQQIPLDGNGLVAIQHQLPGSVTIRTLYFHLSRKDVTVNQQVTEGQQIGLSGNVGCSLNPHLHFGVERATQTNNGQATKIDPYGWSAAGADPWLQNASGARSIQLWKPGQAPELLVRIDRPVNIPPGNVFFGITRVVAMGVNDAANPNNEYVDVSRDPDFAPANVDISGGTIRNRGGVVYTFPAGTVLTPANPSIRVFSGQGASTASVLYMGRATPAYNNIRECVSVFNAGGQLRNQVAFGVNGCDA